jgi:chemotaxis signal transduction protein
MVLAGRYDANPPETAMALYKGMQLDDDLPGLIRHMGSVEGYRETLQTLQGVWDNLTLLGQLSGTGTDMSGTRQAFQRLTCDLLNSLGRETLKKTVQEMQSKAQVAVDIMIRNLFERTADIGFLATDDDIRAYLDGLAPDNEPAAEARARLEARFKEYARKYSVYADILLLTPDGRVRAQLDATHPVRQSNDPLLRQSLTTRQGYVETFRASDLRPGVAQALIYAYRVAGAQGQALGVLCLCFRFENETEGIFANLAGRDDWSVIGLLDEAGTVIASGDAWHIPVGARLEPVLDADWRVVRFAGREYLATTRATRGYQGYMGPGWLGHVMLPLEHAFDQAGVGVLGQVEPEVLAGVMANPVLFDARLRNIPAQAEQIQRELNRSVWNGNVRHSGEAKSLNPAFSKVLLWEISNTGMKTRDVFERSIGNLHETVVSAILENCRFLASLAMDIMDRNLYERANDCRWWALTSAFREHLGAGAQADAMAAILAYINGLYTVYDNLLLFDAHGRVVAVSNPEYAGLRGGQLGEDWVKHCLGLRDSQSYTVSSFTPTPLYRDRPTYIYAAAIRAPNDARIVGGIGIVFDSEPQFEAMLRDALPGAGQGDPEAGGSFGVIAQRDRRIVASTRADLRPGATLDLPAAYFNPDAGRSGIVVHDDHYYAVGSCPSRGYREYKGAEDAYRNEVVALIFVPLGAVAARHLGARPGQPAKLGIASASRGLEECVEIATFHVAGQWFGVRSNRVVEAIEARGLTSVPGTTRNLFGYIMFRDKVMAVINLAVLLGVDAPLAGANAQGRQIVVLRDEPSGTFMGLLVDHLGEIPEIPVERIEKLSAMLGGDNQLAESMVKRVPGEPATEMLVLLSAERIRARIQKLGAPPEAIPGLANGDAID